jgi:protein O-mannosyl-transferase
VTITRDRMLAVLIWSGILAIAWFAYAPGLSGPFLLDDFPNLAGLALVNDPISALHFTLSGSAGPIGRPLALATFVPQAASWNVIAEPFLKVNVLIHLGNACILAWIYNQLTGAMSAGRCNKPYLAVAAAAIWLLMPLLASSSLMIIQRMTTLSATFVLLGMAGYLSARQYMALNPRLALIGMSLALITGTTFAVLAKENGALLPTFVLVIEMTLLTHTGNLKKSYWQAWKSVFLLLPTLLILGYLVWQLPYEPETVLKRGFTGWERLLTEAGVLWEYLFNAFIPQPGKFGPFHDGHAIARTISDPVTLLAVTGWLAVIALAVVWRRRYPLFAFATLWFLGGHLLESSTIQLNVYFEHRNYLPIIGPVYALCALASKVPRHLKRLTVTGALAYIAVNAFVLFSLTSLWGNPTEAVRYWSNRYPDSMYAATELMRQELALSGPTHTARMVSEFVAARPEAGYLKIQELKLSCDIDSDKDHGMIVAEVNRLLSGVEFSYTPLEMLSQLTQTIHQSGCNGVDNTTVSEFARRLLANPRYEHDVIYNQLHHKLMALIAQHAGNTEQSMWHLQEAVGYKPSNDLNRMIVVTYVQTRQFGAARAFIEEWRRKAPLHPMRRLVWLDKLDALYSYVNEVEEAAGLENRLFPGAAPEVQSPL